MKLILFILLNILYTGNISAQQVISVLIIIIGLNDLLSIQPLNSNSKLQPIEYEKKILSANISSVNVILADAAVYG